MFVSGEAAKLKGYKRDFAHTINRRSIDMRVIKLSMKNDGPGQIRQLL